MNGNNSKILFFVFVICAVLTAVPRLVASVTPETADAIGRFILKLL